MRPYRKRPSPRIMKYTAPCHPRRAEMHKPDRSALLTVDAKPYAYTFTPAKTALIVIDMQRDFIEPGGFGDTLGNNIALLAAIVPTTRKLIEICRRHGVCVMHTREAHLRDLSDCPP